MVSGPVQPLDDTLEQGPLARIEVREGRATTVGGMAISRVLPTKGRRTVGPWCFVDHILPPDFDDPHPLEIGPHPHIGLATVTWLFQGEALHSDSLGSEQPIRPGQLNLMSAGHGIAHAELGTTSAIHGVQMWLAQPEETRHGEPRFQHLPDLPVVGHELGTFRVFAGRLGEVESPAVVDSAMVGVEVTTRPGRVELPAEPGFEYAVVPIDHRVKVGETIAEPGWLALVPEGNQMLPLETLAAPTRVLVLGGDPVGPVEMWWNFVARSKEEMTQAWRAWREQDTDRFGPVPSSLTPLEAPTPPWLLAE